jgi:DNA-binding MarR family transcriptional regulator
MSSNLENNPNERQKFIEELSFLGQMLSTETAHFHQSAASRQGLSITDSKTISALMQEGPMTAGQLAQRLSLTTGAITNVIDRLEQRGIVHRVADPKDRRKVVVHTDPKKIEAAGKFYDSIGSAFAKVLNDYSLEELRFLIEYYKTAIEMTKNEVRKLNER